jgi:hypothetical protein
VLQLAVSDEELGERLGVPDLVWVFLFAKDIPKAGTLFMASRLFCVFGLMEPGLKDWESSPTLFLCESF